MSDQPADVTVVEVDVDEDGTPDVRVTVEEIAEDQSDPTPIPDDPISWEGFYVPIGWSHAKAVKAWLNKTHPYFKD